MSDPDALCVLIATRIRRARRRSGLYAHQVAAKAGVGENTVLNIEHGRLCHVVRLDKVARVLGLTLSQLFADEQPS